MRFYILAAMVLAAVTWAELASGRPAVRIIDGDTIQYGHSRVRLLGFDAPEVRPIAACPAEHELGLRARDKLAELLGPPHRMTLRWAAGRDKYGRSLARAYSDHRDVGSLMIDAGLARPYKGGTRLPWC